MLMPRIISSKDDPGNRGNYTRHIEVWGDRWVNLSIGPHRMNKKTLEFNISRKAAEELMMQLDLLLSNTGE